ncbi:MAG: CPBP family intramembrane metalloprotease [Lachnospiraceae bacterium]|nr:CPBP family intramembrane metalloprotease [Lachnospiraceae bacterium]
MEKDYLTAKKDFSRIGSALLVIAVLSIVMQFLLAFLSAVILKDDILSVENSWFIWVATFVPIYAAFPIGILVMKNVSKEDFVCTKLGLKNFFVLMLICFPIMYGGNIIGTVLSGLLSGGNAENGLNTFAFDNNPLKILVMVVLAPILEEFLFRKQIIDRCARYGEKMAILFSALMFGLFHMNLFQFFYAFGLGLVFAYTYTRTRKLRYSVVMHMVINFMGSVIAPALVSSLDMEAIEQMSTGVIDEATMLSMLPQLICFMLYTFALLGLSIAGLVLLIKKVRQLVFLPKEEEIEKGKRFKTVYCNVGVLSFCLLCIAMCVLSIFI